MNVNAYLDLRKLDSLLLNGRSGSKKMEHFTIFAYKIQVNFTNIQSSIHPKTIYGTSSHDIY